MTLYVVSDSVLLIFAYRQCHYQYNNVLIYVALYSVLKYIFIITSFEMSSLYSVFKFNFILFQIILAFPHQF